MLDWLKGAAFIILCLSTTFTVVTVGKHVSNTLMAMDDTVDKLNTEIDEAHRLTLEAALTAKAARKASEKELTMLDAWNDQITLTFTEVQHVLAQSSAMLQQTSSSEAEMSHAAVESTVALNKTITDVQPVLSSATAELQTLRSTTEHLDSLIQDSDITETITNINSTTAHLDATAQDIQEQVHKWTHPGIWTKVKGFALDVAHVFNPL